MQRPGVHPHPGGRTSPCGKVTANQILGLWDEQEKYLIPLPLKALQARHVCSWLASKSKRSWESRAHVLATTSHRSMEWYGVCLMSVTVFKGLSQHANRVGQKGHPQTTTVKNSKSIDAPGKPRLSDLHARGSRRKWAGRAPSRPPSTSTKNQRMERKNSPVLPSWLLRNQLSTWHVALKTTFQLYKLWQNNDEVDALQMQCDPSKACECKSVPRRQRNTTRLLQFAILVCKTATHVFRVHLRTHFGIRDRVYWRSPRSSDVSEVSVSWQENSSHTFFTNAPNRKHEVTVHGCSWPTFLKFSQNAC